MAKEAYFFSHDYGARNDPKLQKLLMKLGHEGKGIYWDIVEMIYEEGGRLKISEIDNYAFALRSDLNRTLSVINDFDLFEKDDNFFWSESILRRLDRRNEKSQKARLSAIERWKNANALDENANAMRQEEKRNAIKDNKEDNNIYNNVSVNIPKNDTEKHLIKIFNEITGRNIGTIQPKAKTQFSNLLKSGYKSKDFKKVISTALSEMTKRNTAHYLTLEFITRPVEFAKYFEMEIPISNSYSRNNNQPDFSNVSN